jgi:hypothetical protein
MLVPTSPAADLVVREPNLAFGIFNACLDRRAATSYLHQCGQVLHETTGIEIL